MIYNISMEGYNGKRAIKKNGQWQIPRSVLVRNVMNVLERNEAYGNLSWCDAETVTDMGTNAELLEIYAKIYNDLPCMDLINKVLSREKCQKRILVSL